MKMILMILLTFIITACVRLDPTIVAKANTQTPLTPAETYTVINFHSGSQDAENAINENKLNCAKKGKSYVGSYFKISGSNATLDSKCE